VASDDSEIRAKLRVLESKRADDAQRIRELEARLTESSAFLAFKPKLQAKLQSLQSEAASFKREVADLKVEKEGVEKKVEELEEELESAVLDREVEVERREEVVAELEAMKEKLAEMEVELGVLRGEKGEGGTHAEAKGDEGGDGVRTSLSYIQLEKQNERLKEALIRCAPLLSHSCLCHNGSVVNSRNVADFVT
jgi:dynactin 1